MRAIVLAVWSLKMDIAADKAQARTPEVLAHRTFDEIFELCSLAERLTRTIGGEHERVADLVEVELSQVCLLPPKFRPRVRRQSVGPHVACWTVFPRHV